MQAIHTKLGAAYIWLSLGIAAFISQAQQLGIDEQKLVDLLAK